MAGEGVNLSPILRLDGDSYENWVRFKRHFNVYLKASGYDIDLSNKTIEERLDFSKTKAKLLLNLVGKRAIDLTTSLELSDEDLNDYDTLIAAFDKYFLPIKDCIYNRLEFHKRVQQDEETFDEFLSEARRLLNSCGYDYSISHDLFLRDKVVMGVRDKNVRDSLLQIRGLTLENAIRHCREAEATDHVRQMDICTGFIKKEHNECDSVSDMTSPFSTAVADEESHRRKRDLSVIRDSDEVSKTKRVLSGERFQRHHRSQCNGTNNVPGPSRRLSSSNDKFELFFQPGEYDDETGTSFKCSNCFLQCLSPAHYKRHETACPVQRMASETNDDLSKLPSFPSERTRNQMSNENDSKGASFDCDDDDFSGSDESEESESDSASSGEDSEYCYHNAHFPEAVSGQESGTSAIPHENTYSTNVSHSWGPCLGAQPHFDYTGCEQIYLAEDRNNMKPADVYQIFVSDYIIDHMVEEINSNAANFLSFHQVKRPGRFNSWTPTHREEMKTFIGLRIWMSLVQLPRFKDYWSDSVVYQNGIAKKAMNRHRFELILRFWHFRKSNPDQGETHIHPILEKLERRFVDARTPGDRLILDEYVIPVNAGETFRRYTALTSDKHAKKEFRLCDPSGYTYRMMVYSEKVSSEQNNARTAAQLIMDLIEPYLDRGRTLCSENSYTSMELVQSLLDRKTHFIGTIDQNARGFPEKVMNAKLRRRHVVAMENKLNGATVLKWRSEQEIQMVSTQFSAALISRGRKKRNGEDSMRPVMLLEYNKMRSGVDRADFLSSFNCVHSASAKWYHKLVDDALFCVSLLNALVIWNKTKSDSTRRMSLLHFGREVCQQFLNVADDPYERTANPTAHYLGQVQELEGATQRKARGRCRGCYKELMKTLDRKKAMSKVKRVSTQCITCPDKPYLCMPCFKNIHEGSIMGQS